MCLERDVLVPITKTFWRGKVGIRDFGACIVIMPITSIYCNIQFSTSSSIGIMYGQYGSINHFLPLQMNGPTEVQNTVPDVSYVPTYPTCRVLNAEYRKLGKMDPVQGVSLEH